MLRVAESESAVEQVLLDRVQHGGARLTNSALGRNAFGGLPVHAPGYSTVAAADGDVAALEIARTDLDAERHAFLDPFPFFHSAAEIAPIDLHFERRAVTA